MRTYLTLTKANFTWLASNYLVYFVLWDPIPNLDPRGFGIWRAPFAVPGALACLSDVPQLVDHCGSGKLTGPSVCGRAMLEEQQLLLPADATSCCRWGLWKNPSRRKDETSQTGLWPPPARASLDRGGLANCLFTCGLFPFFQSMSPFPQL